MSSDILDTRNDRANYRLAEIQDELKTMQKEMAEFMGSDAATAMFAQIKSSPHSFLPDAIGGECTIPAKQVHIAKLFLALQQAERDRNASGFGGFTHPFGHAAQLERLELYRRQVRFLIQRIYFAVTALEKTGVKENMKLPGLIVSRCEDEAIDRDFKDFKEFLKKKTVSYSYTQSTHGIMDASFRDMRGDYMLSNPFRYKESSCIPGAQTEFQADVMRDVLTHLVEFDRQIRDKGKGIFTFPAELQQFEE